MTEQNKLVGYAQDFVSFLISGSYLDGYTIRNILLYGSVARGDFTKESDIDIFIDCTNSDRKLEIEVKRSVEEFSSGVWSKKWKMLGIKNRINCLVGRIEDGKDLHRSIISDGIVIYGKYRPKTKGEHMSLFMIGGIKPEKKRVFITRKLFGYTKDGKPYTGIVSRYNGEKLSGGCFIVPVQFSNKVSALLRERGIDFRTKELSTIE